MAGDVAGGVAASTWTVRTDDGARVRLRSTSAPIGIDVTAPVTGGELTVDGDVARLTLRLALDQLRTKNFLLQAAARGIVSRGGQVLRFDGAGRAGPPVRVSGRASAGTIDVDLDLRLAPAGPAGRPFAQVDVTGAADLGTVDLPIPGFGRIEDFRFDVTARLALTPAPPAPPAPPPTR